MSNKSTPSPVVKEITPEVTVTAPAAPVTVVESNDAFTVEDNTEVVPTAEVAVEEVEVPLMDGFVQVNYA